MKIIKKSNMNIYHLPEFNPQKLKTLEPVKMLESGKKTNWLIWILIFFVLGVLIGLFFNYYLYSSLRQEISKAGVSLSDQEQTVEYIPQTTEEDKVIKVVKEVSPTVVSVVITKEVPVYSEYDPFSFFWGVPQIQGTEKKQVGAGSGFIISSDGMILTNKHVVEDEKAEYTIVTNDDKEYPVKVLARDPVQDIAILKIENSNEIFPVVKLGSMSNIQIGQTAIAIGNALGELKNTVSVGVISGLGRTVVATGANTTETLEDIIQTDAAINPGNSGGPLLNLMGEVIGINTAVASSGENIGFAIPINKAIRDIEQVKNTGKISYPFLGVRYVVINEDVAKQLNLSVTYGVLITKGKNLERAITPDSAADKAGLQENDIILELNGVKIDKNNSLASLISEHLPGDTVSLKILRNETELMKTVTLGEWK
jgi:serine protease Do